MIEQEHRLKKFNHVALPEIFLELDLPDDVLAVIKDIDTDIAIIDALKAAGELEFAIKFLAYGLPEREVIWWAYRCSVALESNNADDVTQQGLNTVETWVKTPTEALRRTAGKLGDALGFYSATSWLNMAVFWSGGSITPEGKPEVEPTEFMCQTAASNAIIFAADKADDKTQFMQHALKRGLHIAMGGNGNVE